MALSESMQPQISILITYRWLRLNGLSSTILPQHVVDLISAHFLPSDAELFSNELTVNIAIVGDDVADKIGMIYSYIHDYHCSATLDAPHLDQLRRQNERQTLRFQKAVQLSATKRVSISMHCLSEQQRSALSDGDVLTVDAVMFCFNLCHQSSLQSLKSWYREIVKLRRPRNGQNDVKPFVPLLVGTHFGAFRERLANHRISVMEQARKYAAKMGAALLFVETEPMQQINIKELFLITLSRHYHFDANIPSVSGSKLPVIEYHDHSKQSKATQVVILLIF